MFLPVFVLSTVHVLDIGNDADTAITKTGHKDGEVIDYVPEYYKRINSDGEGKSVQIPHHDVAYVLYSKCINLDKVIEFRMLNSVECKYDKPPQKSESEHVTIYSFVFVDGTKQSLALCDQQVDLLTRNVLRKEF